MPTRDSDSCLIMTHSLRDIVVSDACTGIYMVFWDLVDTYTDTLFAQIQMHGCVAHGSVR